MCKDVLYNKIVNDVFFNRIVKEELIVNISNIFFVSGNIIYIYMMEVKIYELDI